MPVSTNKIKNNEIRQRKPLAHFAKCVSISSCLNYFMLPLIYSGYTGFICGCLLSIVIKLIIISYCEKAMQGVMILILQLILYRHISIINFKNMFY